MGIDAEEDVVKCIEVGDSINLEHCHPVENRHVLDECLLLLFGISVVMDSLPIEHVVSDVVVWPQAVVAVDALVDEPCHLLVIFVGSEAVKGRQFLFPELWTNLEVYPALALSDACEDACDIFAWAFDVFLIAADI